ncbi:MAG: hypothetical protein DMG58_11795 [Acidobacteria bacterium]|nr:MAG: hypothetical protein DMG58_11795 [Acidobacteriota bacterium]
MTLLGSLQLHSRKINQAISLSDSTGDFHILGQARKPEPKHIHGRGGLDRFDAGKLTQLGETAVGADGQRSTQLVQAIRPEILHSADDAIFFHKLPHVGARHQPERGILRGLFGDELQNRD